MSWLLLKYIRIISPRLVKFKERNNVFNCRCFYCGDSQTNKNKARAYILFNGRTSVYYCHNCGKNISAEHFLKDVSPNDYQDYLYEKISNSRKPEAKKEESAPLELPRLAGLKSINQLENDNKTRQYVIERKIPEKFHSLLYECPNFRRFCNSLIPDKFSEKSLFFDETRLLIPFFNQNGEMLAVQGRALDEHSEPKYLTISFGDIKLYGLERVNFNENILVLEGPIDSLFLPNAIATAGGDLVSALAGYDKNNFTIVYDNEKRNKHTIKKINSAISHGFKVVVWPSDLESKDINQMVESGLTSEEILGMIQTRTFEGNEASLELAMWRKV